MSWIAVRTHPGAQMPQREYLVEQQRINPNHGRGKGYRIVPSLNPSVSAIERALKDAGFVCYMPSEKRLIRDRLRTDLWKTRRYALLLGYVFVQAPCNLLKLTEVPGVAGIVGTKGEPLPVAITDILHLRTVEAKAEAEFDRASINTQRSLRKKARNQGDKKLKALLDSFSVTGTTTIEVGTKLVAA